MNVYELVNPSDPYTFDAPDDDLATAVVLFISDMCGWKCGDRQGGPYVLVTPDSSAGRQLLEKVKRIAAERRPELIAALRSVELRKEERLAAGVDDVERWHNDRRSSLTDHRARARQLADSFERTPA